MPIFVDRHLTTEVDPVVRRRMLLEALHGVHDPSGALPVGHWVEDEVIYCLLDAPDVEAICRHHRDRGLSCDDVHLIAGLTASRPLSDATKEIVRTNIGQLWPGSAARQSVPE